MVSCRMSCLCMLPLLRFSASTGLTSLISGSLVMQAPLLAFVTIRDEVFDDRRVSGPAQNMLLLFQQELFGDQSAMFLHVMHFKGGAREFKLDFLKAILWSNQTQVHPALWKKCFQIIEAKETNRNIGACLFNFIGGDYLLVHEPEHINLADYLL